MHRVRTPCEHKGRDWGDASTSQGMPKIASKTPETSREAWDILSFTDFRRNLPYQHLVLRLLACSSLGKLIQPLCVCVCVWTKTHTKSPMIWVASTEGNRGGKENFHFSFIPFEFWTQCVYVLPSEFLQAPHPNPQ